VERKLRATRSAMRSPLVVLWFFAAAATVRAECAWVLWTSASGTAPNGVSYAGTQFPDSIYESRDGCYRVARCSVIRFMRLTISLILSTASSTASIRGRDTGSDASLTSSWRFPLITKRGLLISWAIVVAWLATNRSAARTRATSSSCAFRTATVAWDASARINSS
jgi:hypothetical protein